MTQWIDAQWKDVRPGTRVRRDNGDTGTVTFIEPYHAEQRVTLGRDDGGSIVLSVWPTNSVGVEVEL